MEIKFYDDDPPTLLTVTGYLGEDDTEVKEEYDYQVLDEGLYQAGQKVAEEAAKDKFRELVASGKYSEVTISRNVLLFSSNLSPVEEPKVSESSQFKIIKDTVRGAQSFEWNILWQAWAYDHYEACREAAEKKPELFPYNEMMDRVPLQAYGAVGSGTKLLNWMQHLGMSEVEGHVCDSTLPFLRAWGKEQGSRFLIVNADGSEEAYTE